MGKAKVLGQFKPYVPNSKAYGKNRKAPWQGSHKKPAQTAAKRKDETK